jgi:TatD DNase family protein
VDWAGGEDAPSVDEKLAAAAAANVTRVVQIGCELDSARWTAEVVNQHAQMLGGVALHPNEAPRHANGTHASGISYEEAFAEIATLARGERVRVVGETGLDFFRTGPDGVAAQVRSFRDHVALARELGMPVQIHDRDAHEEVLRVMDGDGAPRAVIMHCFSGDADFARECLERGWYLSFAGTVTFANAPALREAAVITPSDRLLVETDAPFLTPVPHRGRPNSPAQAANTVRALAAARGDKVEQLCVDIQSNSEDLYGPW